jgi:hypothetical protein
MEDTTTSQTTKFYLYRFSSKANMSFKTHNNDELNASFEFLKSHYKFLGILTIVLVLWSMGFQLYF